MAFTAPYQSIYDAAIARQRETEARQRAGALSAAGRMGVSTSGVSQIPQNAIAAEAIRSEGDIGADVAAQQEQERLNLLKFDQQKELMNMQNQFALSMAADERARQRAAGKSQLIGQIGGAVLGGVGGGLAKKYL